MSSFQFLKDWLVEGKPEEEQPPATTEPAAAQGLKVEQPPPAAQTKPQDNKPAAPAKAPELPNVGASISKMASAAKDKSIAMLLIFILFVVLAIVPTASGASRLQLFWGVISKGGKMRDQAVIGADGSSTSDGASGATTGDKSVSSTIKDAIVSGVDHATDPLDVRDKLGINYAAKKIWDWLT